MKLAILAVAMLVAIGSWQMYWRGEAQAQLNLLYSNSELPHFKCYNFTPAGPPVKEDVVLQDQFTTQTVTVQTRRFLCAPVRKDHNGKYFDADISGKHLVCYQIHPAGGTLKQEVTATDQFRMEDGTVGTPHLLCAPADKMAHQ